MIGRKGLIVVNMLQQVQQVLEVLLLEFAEVDKQRRECLGPSTLNVPYASITEARERWAGGRIRNAWEMIGKGATAEEVDKYLDSLVEWEGVNPDLLRAQRHGLRIELLRVDSMREEICDLLGRWDALERFLASDALGIAGASGAPEEEPRRKKRSSQSPWMNAVASVFLTQEGDKWIVPRKNEDGLFEWQSIGSMIEMFRLAEESDYAPLTKSKAECNGNAAKTYIYSLWKRSKELFPTGWPGPDIGTWYLTIQHWRSNDMLQAGEERIPSDPG